MAKLPSRHIWKTCRSIGTVSYFVGLFICPRQVLCIVCIEGVQWRFSFVFRSTGISSNSSIALFLTNFNVRPVLGIFCPANSLSCKRLHHSNLLNLLEQYLLSLVRTRCFISFPPVGKRSSTNRWMIPATDFSAAASSYGIQRLFKCSNHSLIAHVNQ